MEKKLKFTFSALISMQQHAMKSKTQKKSLKNSHHAGFYLHIRFMVLYSM